MPDAGQFAAFFLVFLRSLAFLMSGPLYAIRGIPPLVKALFALALAVVVFPVLGSNTAVPADAWNYTMAIISETGTGLLFGFAVTMFINSFRMVGQFIDLQIGFAMASLMDPMSGTQGTLLSQYLYLLAMIFFLMMDGHHMIISAMVRSFELAPLGLASINGSAVLILTRIFSGAFTIALQVGAPVLAVLLVSDMTLGFLARTTPQINVFLTGFPIKIAAGLLTLSLLIPLLGTVLRSLFNMIERDLYSLMKVLG